MVDINLNFTGDFAAIAAANNLLAASQPNHDARSTSTRGRSPGSGSSTSTTGPCGSRRRTRWPGQRVPSRGWFRHRRGLRGDGDLLPGDVDQGPQGQAGRIVVGYTRAKKPVRAADLKAHGPMAVILRDALAPNLVQTLEHTPALIHGGPFANIAHGCNSVIATTAALKLADYVITEAGFGADLGPKFIDIKCRGRPVSSSDRARRDSACPEVPRRCRRRRPKAENVPAMEEGMSNLRRHLRNVTGSSACPRLSRSTVSPATPMPRSSAQGTRRRPRLGRGRGNPLQRWRRGVRGSGRAVVEAVEACAGPVSFTYPTSCPWRRR